MTKPQWTGRGQTLTSIAPKRSIDDAWRTWIAENLVRGQAPEGLQAILTNQGFSAADACKEIALAQASPYLRVAERLTARLAKHDWVLEIQRKLTRMRPSWNQIERRHRLAREVFFEDFYASNRPVIITGMMDDWPALAKWTPAWLQENFGERMVEVQANRHANQRYEIDQTKHRQKMRFADYVDRVVNGGNSNDIYMTANNSDHNTQALQELWDDVVQVPEYLDGNSSQRGFFWFGPAGTVTPLHHDLTNNFMAQVHGRKQIRLMPAEELPYVYNHLHCYSEVDVDNIDYTRFPLMHETNLIDCEIGPGEILFLPVGCWHHVRALDISITMTFTNFVFDNDFQAKYRTYHEV